MRIYLSYSLFTSVYKGLKVIFGITTLLIFIISINPEIFRSLSVLVCATASKELLISYY